MRSNSPRTLYLAHLRLKIGLFFSLQVDGSVAICLHAPYLITPSISHEPFATVKRGVYEHAFQLRFVLHESMLPIYVERACQLGKRVLS